MVRFSQYTLLTVRFSVTGPTVATVSLDRATISSSNKFLHHVSPTGSDKVYETARGLPTQTYEWTLTHAIYNIMHTECFFSFSNEDAPFLDLLARDNDATGAIIAVKRRRQRCLH